MKRSLALCIALLATPALADEPLPLPEEQTVCSSSGTTCAVSDPATRTTTVSAQSAPTSAWTIPGWHRWLFVANDGASVVVGYDGMNLAPVDVTLEEPVFFFYNRGDLVRTVTLGDLYTDKAQLARTVSHLAWVRTVGMNQADQLVVELVDGRTIAFAASTGQVQPTVADGSRR